MQVSRPIIIIGLPIRQFAMPPCRHAGTAAHTLVQVTMRALFLNY